MRLMSPWVIVCIDDNALVVECIVFKSLLGVRLWEKEKFEPVISDVWEPNSWLDLRVLWPTTKSLNEWYNKVNQLIMTI